jgi:hypothetical protein
MTIVAVIVPVAEDAATELPAITPVIPSVPVATDAGEDEPVMM